MQLRNGRPAETFGRAEQVDQTVQLHRRRVNADMSVQDEGSDVLFRGDEQPLRHELEHFLSCVEAGERPRSDGVSAIPVIRVLAQADEQMKELNRPL